MLESAESDPRLAYNYATTEDGDADREQGRKVQERTLRVMRFSLFLGLLVVAGVFLGFFFGGLLKSHTWVSPFVAEWVAKHFQTSDHPLF